MQIIEKSMKINYQSNAVLILARLMKKPEFPTFPYKTFANIPYRFLRID